MSVVLSFPRRRGRPRIQRPSKDFGTPELQFKRAHGETAEMLDLCLAKGLISSEQHWCGIHLRWLFTLRYGLPSVMACDPTYNGGHEIIIDDATWREAREAEYHAALVKIAGSGHAKLLADICIHNERPDFLRRKGQVIADAGRSLDRFRDGLDILVRHWRRKKSQP